MRELEQELSELILIPAPAVGHLVSAGEFAKRLLTSPSTKFGHVTILLLKPPNLAPQLDAYSSSLTSSEPRVTVVSLPPAPPPPLHVAADSLENFYILYIEAHSPHVKTAAEEIVSTRRRGIVSGFVLDFFCGCFVDVAREMGLPAYMYVPSGGAMLTLMLHLPTRQETREFDEKDPEFSMPGFFNPVPPRVLPSAVFSPKGGYTAFMKMAKRFRECKGIIVNTFMELETYAISSLSEDKTVPPIYAVGPVVDLKGEGQNSMGSVEKPSQGNEIIEWLDEQPDKSVVFLCFGSIGVFSAPQMEEIANGLEMSGFRFLWSARAPPGCNDVNEILPEGFIERTKGRGIVCGWVSQVDILAHNSIGGFVSHCGWNSTLESLWNGVPIATWPMYAEQQINAFMLVKELGIAVELRLDFQKDGDEVVPAEEVEAAVSEVMKCNTKVRQRVKEMSDKSRAALKEGGSSYKTMEQFINDAFKVDVRCVYYI